MNIRIGDGGVRCRISCEELKFLITGGKIEEMLTLAGKPLLLTIDPSGEGRELSLVYEEGLIGLRVSKKALQGLDQMGRKKDGIISQMSGSVVSLEVDLKSYSREKTL